MDLPCHLDLLASGRLREARERGLIPFTRCCSSAVSLRFPSWCFLPGGLVRIFRGNVRLLLLRGFILIVSYGAVALIAGSGMFLMFIVSGSKAEKSS
jgi:hypothetical protein